MPPTSNREGKTPPFSPISATSFVTAGMWEKYNIQTPALTYCPSRHGWVSPVASRQQSSSQVNCWARNIDNRLSCYCHSVTGRAAALWQQRNHWHLSVWEESMHSKLLSHLSTFHGLCLSEIGAKTGNCQFSKFEITLSWLDVRQVASWV